MSEEQLKALQNENEDLQDRLDRTLKELGVFSRALLEANVRIKELKAKLSEHEKGLPIEKAKTEKQYFRIDEYGYPALVECSDADGCWYVRISDQDFDLVQSGPLYPLPSETKEGS